MGYWDWQVLVSKVKISKGAGSNGYDDMLIEVEDAEEDVDSLEVAIKCAEIQNAISVGELPFSCLSLRFIFEFCFLGMKIATYANARTTLEARKGVNQAFITAFRSGAVMGFLLAANGLLVFYVSINLFKLYGDDWEGLYECITGYGQGGTSMVLFGRVGRDIYKKATDVGAELVGKVERTIPEDDPRNPADIVCGLWTLQVLALTLTNSSEVLEVTYCLYSSHNINPEHTDVVQVTADNVGDNVGDIAGMGSDLFGSYAESSCAALYVASVSSFGINHDYTAMSYPLIISSMGIVTAGIGTVSSFALPLAFTLFNFGTEKIVKNWHLFFCVAIGLWAGLVIGYATEYYTSNAYSPVQDVADSCRTGAATNVIFGLALGHKSVIIPIFAIAIAIYVSFSLAAMYGIAVAALGMLSTIATGLAIDAYGPISDNAGGIAEMAGMTHKICERTDALDAAGNTTAAIGKASLPIINYLSLKLLFDSLQFSLRAVTMKSVGSAALKMVEEVCRQFNTIPGLTEGRGKPDHATCVKISTYASLREMIPPGALVMLTPLTASTLFGVETLAGVLAGSLVSGVQVCAKFMSRSPFPLEVCSTFLPPHPRLPYRHPTQEGHGITPTNTEKHSESLGPKGSDAHKATVIGDTVGDPLKDTSDPSLNILIKLMAVESLVFAPFFATHGGFLFKLLSV
ncbi:H(+)-exporting diphosphatase [Citrus sinensis]|uniref:H(+)-exporting diphosphatase n=1 Tax=Citrus sinensis TaxID=2711 RepID=A0ACB8KM92_CITSI|nr:H(+)-exporting diphosphatase [Citrus sinensis]